MKAFGMWAAALAVSGCAATESYDGGYGSAYDAYAPHDGYVRPYDGYGPSYGGYSYQGYSYAPSYRYAVPPPLPVRPPAVIHRHTTIVTPRPPPPVVIERRAPDRRRVNVTEEPRRREIGPDRRSGAPDRRGIAGRDGHDDDSVVRERRRERGDARRDSRGDAPAAATTGRADAKPRRKHSEERRDRRG